ncbi:MAG: AAA family ATPase [Myxococcota bacterium]
MTALPVCRAAELETCPEERRWLVEGLWADQAVGVIGGEPKCYKSFLALDLAVAVASGAPGLRHFRVAQTGPVLLFAAEDPLPVVRERLEGIAGAAGVPFRSLDVHVITAPRLRLDQVTDRRALRETLHALRPRLLILDPFVRLHRIDENAVAEVAPLLASLRELQRRFQTAVLLVHHARKGASHVRAGQALRGSSEIHAWGDSNLYLQRKLDAITLTIEHRAAASPEPLTLELHPQPDALALRVASSSEIRPEPAAPADLTERILSVLARASEPLTRAELRRACRMRTRTLGDLLHTLTQAGRILREDRGYQLARSSPPAVSRFRYPEP